MTDRGLAIFINGLPGSGKSTVARRLVASRPGWFLLDIDVLRTFIGGWAVDFGEAGRIIRPIAHAIVCEVVAGGGVVVVPQLLFEADELLGLAGEARSVGGDVLHVLLEVTPAECWRRLQRRGSDNSGHALGEDSLAAVVAAAVESAGGMAFLEELSTSLTELRDCEIPAHPVPGQDTALALTEINALIIR
jgi:hypothetical protein